MIRPDLSFEYNKIVKNISSMVIKYRFSLTIVVIVGVFAFAIYRVDSLANPDINQDRFLEQIQTVKKVSFDEAAVEAIQELEQTDVQVDPELIDDRDNPFSE